MFLLLLDSSDPSTELLVLQDTASLLHPVMKGDKGRYLQEFSPAVPFCPSGIVVMTEEM